jgi:alkylation response protein AidB-like acyl-CoA dehydrogenase
MQSRAVALDQEAAFPTEEVDRLRQQIGAHTLSADRLAGTLMSIGQGNLSVGRIMEAHVNVLHLMALYGTDAQRNWAGSGDDVFALWVTDPPEGGLRMQRSANGIVLQGAKQFCSGAGHVTAALITAEDSWFGARMLAVRLNIGETVTPLPAPLQGMRAATTGAVDFSGCVVQESALVGEPGDYLREPAFSTGAWRGSAVACGGLIALVDHAVRQLRQAGRLDSPFARERLGALFIARETARHWVNAAARIGEDRGAGPGLRIATVGLARIAVEAACLDAMRLVQRSMGLSAFLQGSLVELICRDLATYLRQPAPDEVLTEAGAWFADHPHVLT